MHRDIFHFLADLFFPARCIVCDNLLKTKNTICNDCDKEIIWVKSDFFNPKLEREWFDRGHSLAIFDGKWQKVLHNLKYNKRTDLVVELGKRLSARIDYEYDLILPIPLHKSRLRERGYNQSALVAKRLSKESGIDVRFDLLEKVAETRPQVGLSLEERLKNVKESFAVQRPELVKDRDILLVDDVMTTGATVNECSRILKKCGASRVDVITIARV